MLPPPAVCKYMYYVGKLEIVDYKLSSNSNFAGEVQAVQVLGGTQVDECGKGKFSSEEIVWNLFEILLFII